MFALLAGALFPPLLDVVGTRATNRRFGRFRSVGMSGVFRVLSCFVRIGVRDVANANKRMGIMLQFCTEPVVNMAKR